MAHKTTRCEFIDVLEESVVTGRSVAVELRGGRRFVDRVREVVTENGEDFALFRDHDRVPVSDILDATRGEPIEPTYAGKV